jgi:hypothetical protein
VLRQRLGRLALVSSFLVVVLVILLPGLTRAQTARNFRLTWNVEKTTPTSTEIAGRIANESRLEAFDVYLTVEALDEKGKILARGLTHVSPMIRPFASEPFVAKVPVVPGIASYRVLVSSFRFGLGNMQNP